MFVWKGATVEVLDRATREELQRTGHAHQFAALSRGEVHYRISGSANGELALLICGLALPMQVWDVVAAALVGDGFRVIAFDGYGRVLSSRPSAGYEEALFDALNLELLDYLDVTEPVHVAGYSAGGIAATVLAARHPERLRWARSAASCVVKFLALRTPPLPTESSALSKNPFRLLSSGTQLHGWRSSLH